MTKAYESLTADSLPLPVREHLMRGQQAGAIAMLVSEYGKTEDEANQLIEAYREQLRERKLALEVQVMQAANNREEDERKQTVILWGVRLAVLGFVLALLMLLFK